MREDDEQERQRGRDGTRAQLLRTGHELLAATPVSGVLPGVRAVCQASGVATSSFYWCFENVDAFWRALVASIAAHDSLPEYSEETAELLDAAAAAIREDRSAAPALIRTLAAGNLEHHLGEGRTEVELQLLLLGAAHEDGGLADTVRAEYRALYDAIRAAHDGAYERLLKEWGRRPREPFTVGSISILLTALADGLLLRGLLRDGTDVHTLFEDAVVGLLAAATTAADDDRDLAAFLRDELG
jgi:AcrR family transcriptional regulator